MSKTITFDLQRKVVSHMTSKSWANIPHVSYLYEPDVTDFLQEYQALLRSRGDRAITLNTLMLRTVVEGLKAAPELNATLSYHHRKGEGELRISDTINVCLPWTLPDGRMITPVIQNAEVKTLDALSQSVAEMKERIERTNIDELLYRAAFSDTVEELKKFHLGIFRRILASQISFHRVKGLSGAEKRSYYQTPENRRLSERNLVSGTVTVSNIGSLYQEQRGCFALLEIIPPQVFAVGLGAVTEKPGVYLEQDGAKAIGIRKTLPMCLVFDHRALDFNALVPFLKALDGIFLNPDVIRNW